ncbi:peptide deformylase [Thioploca ingrica]|uniref:Peptide deformylase n=1 Tax=Thioploca ingrica TaxID=40754 RepID=A0A090BUA6_9GAMM|nr:peptide deformylase [Thioploca ingrica]
MALLEILHFPDPRLRIQAKPVKQVDENISKIVDDMFETMYEAPGIGLAATQVNIHLRIIVIDLSAEKNQPLCLINPLILNSEGVTCTEEGCLSVPGIFESVERADQITVQALNQQGESYTLTTENLLSVCIQHEMDHLQGKLFVDYLSLIKRERIRKKLLKQKRQVAV